MYDFGIILIVNDESVTLRGWSL